MTTNNRLILALSCGLLMPAAGQVHAETLGHEFDASSELVLPVD